MESAAEHRSPGSRDLGHARALLQTGRYRDAQTVISAVIEHDRLSPVAHYLLGELLFLQRMIDDAVAAYEQALRLGIGQDPELRAHSMSGVVPGDFGWMCHMLRGDFEAAWRLSDVERASRPPPQVVMQRPRHHRSVWDGTPFTGRRVLVRCHHGLGDTIQFARYLPLLAETADAVTVRFPRCLGPLFAATDPPYALEVDNGDASGVADDAVEVEITELPYAFRTQSNDIPAAVPYLSADPARIAEVRRRLRAERRIKIGLVWAAGGWKPERSIPLPLLARLANDPWVALYSLQRGPAAEAWSALGRRDCAIGALSSDDVLETAATICALDLVVTVDTMVAHLAGALGAPVWTLLHHSADWRWLLDRADSPWYPSMTLFRQPKPDDWDGLMAQASRTLSQHIQASTFRCSRSAESASTG